jgi:hypothetical protein
MQFTGDSRQCQSPVPLLAFDATVCSVYKDVLNDMFFLFPGPNFTIMICPA